jgi:predicted transcriptional regulator YheO
MRNKDNKDTADKELKEQLIFEVLGDVFDSLAQTLGSNCEVTLHDLRKPLDRSIIKIKNGHITGRALGGPMSKPGLNFLKSQHMEDLQVEKLFTTSNGRIVKGAPSLIYNEKTEPPVAMLAIIFDLTDVIKLNTSINSIFGISEQSLQAERTSLFLNDADKKISQMADDIIARVGKPVSEFEREDKIEIVNQLKALGFFKIKGSMKIISAKLASSKYTLYSYLNSGNSE